MLRNNLIGKGVVRKMGEDSEPETPSKAGLEINDSVMSPDMIPPTPPQPKRMKLDDGDKCSTKLKPRALIPTNSTAPAPNIPVQNMETTKV